MGQSLTPLVLERIDWLRDRVKYLIERDERRVRYLKALINKYGTTTLTLEECEQADRLMVQIITDGKSSTLSIYEGIPYYEEEEDGQQPDC